MSELPKTFDPAAIEARWYARWEATGAFRPSRPDAEPFTIMMPPPNVTGSLHIGHALDVTLQDVLVRHARLRGRDALWVVGTDHAGIATQMVVERQLNERQDKRTNYSREDFVAKVWEWKAESGGTITRQLRRLGASCDWANERFTMDPGFSEAVIRVFVRLYHEGLIYRDKRLVNWDPGLKTAISDLEVETKEVPGKFWHFRYPLADGVRTADGLDHIVVATTRPETMLADMAVAVNARDERYQSLLAAGAQVLLPITGRRVPVIADDHADPELGSGAVKITPGHDFNDFEVGVRAGIAARDMLNMFDGDACVVQVADGLIPDALLGLERFDARARVVERMEALGAVERVEERVIATPLGDRSGAVIEPWLTDQWYVDAKTLAVPAMEAVRDGRIKIVPAQWEKTFFNWMENIQPWCVSRQLWWGHRIPVWQTIGMTRDADDRVTQESYGVYAAESEMALRQRIESEGETRIIRFFEDWDAVIQDPDFAAFDRDKYMVLVRDQDVLDTWFSSALWPFATLGWTGNESPTPDPSPEGEGSLLAKHYPGDVLVSGFDILFFWDARMMMQGLHLMGEVPFRTLYLHGLVRAADGSKMSKSKGNAIDPLGLIDRYGADALRFTLAAMESQGRDIKLSEERVQGYRNFATKLWNAVRFAQANGIGASAAPQAPMAAKAVNRWIIGEVAATVVAMDAALAALRFDEAANAIYRFVWDVFCDWYLELVKGEVCDETRAVAGWAIDQALVLLHPLMPFITEELWHALGAREAPIIHARWPVAAVADDEAAAEIGWLVRLVREVRAARTELGVAPGVRLPAHLREASAVTRARWAAHAGTIARMARIEAAEGDGPAAGAAQLVVDEMTVVLPLEGVIDLAAERARLGKARDAAAKEAAALAGRLGNPAFVEKAKPEAVAKARADHAEKAAEAERLGAALARLG
ncbi:valine--tRNA ligase [Sandaracinobacteroides saxicola]|uniref:Valine--tRNA ligase n=1 Tax=Sandaracinobacteroides saxicola TaxID=2759707 RepID=A0A7G5IJX0_9SPHN|nr:valine--tRNA ligase [Sandaracinobacteroides saxicola]QMW23662.1 valine--tRNA ligase [Sandaracinobacteroides saxicola]